MSRRVGSWSSAIERGKWRGTAGGARRNDALVAFDRGDQAPATSTRVSENVGALP